MKMFWSDSETRFATPIHRETEFELVLYNLKVGTLSFRDQHWRFVYSDAFKAQRKVLPLVNFPTVDKEYVSTELWPFFASRIPSRAQLLQKGGPEELDLVSLLGKYGKSTIANPFTLSSKISS